MLTNVLAADLEPTSVCLIICYVFLFTLENLPGIVSSLISKWQGCDMHEWCDN